MFENDDECTKPLLIEDNIPDAVFESPLIEEEIKFEGSKPVVYNPHLPEFNPNFEVQRRHSSNSDLNFKDHIDIGTQEFLQISRLL